MPEILLLALVVLFVLIVGGGAGGGIGPEGDPLTPPPKHSHKDPE